MSDERWTLEEIEEAIRAFDATDRDAPAPKCSGLNLRHLLLTARDALTKPQPSESDEQECYCSLDDAGRGHRCGRAGEPSESDEQAAREWLTACQLRSHVADTWAELCEDIVASLASLLRATREPLERSRSRVSAASSTEAPMTNGRTRNVTTGDTSRAVPLPDRLRSHAQNEEAGPSGGYTEAGRLLNEAAGEIERLREAIERHVDACAYRGVISGERPDVTALGLVAALRGEEE